MRDIYSYSPKEVAAMWEVYNRAPDDTPAVELRQLMDAAADEARAE